MELKPLLPRTLAKLVSKSTKVALLVFNVTEFLSEKALSTQKYSTLMSLHALDRAAHLLVYAAQLETRKDSVANLDCVFSDATAYATTAVALWFNVGRALAAHSFQWNMELVNCLNIIFGYTETSQSLSYGVQIVKTDIYSQISWAELVYSLLCFIIIQRTTIARKHKSSLRIKWESSCVDTSIDKSVLKLRSIHFSESQQLLSQINALASLANENGKPVKYQIKIAETTERAIDVIANGETKAFTEQVTSSKLQFGVITPGEALKLPRHFDEPTDIDCHINLSLACRYRKYQSASYGRSFLHYSGLASTVLGYHEHVAFAEYVGISPESIVCSSYSDGYSLYRFSSSPLIHFISIDTEAKALVVTLRGTFDLQDVITDAMCQYAKFTYQGVEYKAHCGMLRSARLVLQSSLIEQLHGVLTTYSDYSLIICGHSLGAGVAAILSLLITEKRGDKFVTTEASGLPPGHLVKCISYAPPAVVSLELSNVIEGLVTSVIYSDDVVPHLSLGVLWDLKAVTLELKNQKHKVRTLMKYALSRTPAGIATYLDFFLENLRLKMVNEKLMPPGTIYRIDSDIHPSAVDEGLQSTKSTLFDHTGTSRSLPKRVTVSQVINKALYFNEPIFSREMFYHTSNYYEKSLDVLAHSFHT